MEKKLLLLLIIITTGQFTFAQIDSAGNGYYITYPNRLMLRVYLSQKFAPFTISSENEPELNYQTNKKLNLGVGFTYNSLTANLAYGFKFLNKEKGKGTTKGLDLQIHIYPRKWAVDILASSTKGFYLDPKDNNGLALAKFYLRPDIKRNVYGASIFKLGNPNKFSFKAAAIQSELQLRSAGTLLYGGEAYFGTIKGDSALVPSKGNNIYKQAGLLQTNFFSIGPGIGYAYSLVIQKHLFLTGAVIGTADVNFATEEKAGYKKSKVSVCPGAIFKGAVGYNSGTWSISGNVLGNLIYSSSIASSKEYFLPTGNMQFILAKKLGVHKK